VTPGFLADLAFPEYLALEGREAYAAAFAVAPEIDRRTTIGRGIWADFLAVSAGRTVLTASEVAP